MADNINVTQGSGTSIATDDVGGIHYQKVKLDLGGNGVSVPLALGQAASAASIPVVLSAAQETLLSDIESAVDGLEGSFTTLNAKDFATQTTLAAVLAKIIAAPATEAKQDTIITALGTIDGHVDGLETAVAASNTKLDTLHADLDRTSYETVAAGQTDQALGATGATGDILQRVVIIPANTSPGAVSIKDGAGSDITIFAGGASSLDVATPFVVELGMKSASGAWKITTGADVSAIGIGKFTA